VPHLGFETEPHIIRIPTAIRFAKLGFKRVADFIYEARFLGIPQ
jgi:hypothetical protein